MNVKRILIVEDEHPIREMLGFALSDAGFETDEAIDAQQAQAMITEQRPDLILLDWMLPGQSGLDYARHLRRDNLTREIPIIMLTARAEEQNCIRALKSGVDDYMTKPFSPRELIARIEAVLRRGGPTTHDDVLEAQGLKMNTASHRVSADNVTLNIAPTEYQLLKFFMSNPDRVYSRSQLLDRIWGGNIYVEERTVDVHIRRLRKALKPQGYDGLIQTVRSAGYRFSTHC